MKYSENLNLSLPEASDFVDVTVLDANFEKLDSLFKIYTVTLKGGSAWGSSAPYTQTVTLDGISADAYPMWYFNGTPTADEFEAFSYISSMETGDGTLTFTAVSERPETDVSIMIK